MTIESAAVFDARSQAWHCQGEWNLPHLSKIQSLFSAIIPPPSGEIIIDGQAITKLDSAGAWLISQFIKKMEDHTLTVNLKNFSEEHHLLLSLVMKQTSENLQLPTPHLQGTIAQFGRYSLYQLKECSDFFSMIGQLSLEALNLVRHPVSIRWKALAHVILKTGYEALPIIALLSFMIGVVITYQMGLQLRNYGANAFIVDLLGLSILREFAPLLTAIMVAGRTGSAYTAQLGMMKINQEIDALNTLGITPGEILLIPRIIGLVIALPLLTFWADIFGIIGGMVMSHTMLNITTVDFLLRFEQVIPLRALLIGLGKAPVFALIIASIGCFQGMTVKGSADSVGKNTTRSVVLAIFFIIVADALFSIIFSHYKL